MNYHHNFSYIIQLLSIRRVNEFYKVLTVIAITTKYYIYDICKRH